LEKKLKITDQDEEILNLKQQMNVRTKKFDTLEEQKKDLDELIIKVSKQLRQAQMEMKDEKTSLEGRISQMQGEMESLKTLKDFNTIEHDRQKLHQDYKTQAAYL
jgi:hypothetical protein